MITNCKLSLKQIIMSLNTDYNEFEHRLPCNIIMKNAYNEQFFILLLPYNLQVVLPPI